MDPQSRTRRIGQVSSSVDFARDRGASGRRPRILNVIDDVTKDCVAAVVGTSISGRRVARELEAIVAWRGKPELIVPDHGTEFTSAAMPARIRFASPARHLIARGNPQQAGLREAVDVRMRGELSNEMLFFSLDAARQYLARWVEDYNHRRAHSALG